MAKGKYCVYYRVSTRKQGRSGLGLEAQKAAVESYLNGGSWQVVGEFTEIESGKNRNRPALAEAMRKCRTSRATLLVAKQDRLSRNAAQILQMLDEGKVPFVCADDPSPSKLSVGIKAIVAQEEAIAASVRTKAALKAAKERGKKLGGQRGDWRVATVAADGHAASLEVRRAKAAERVRDLLPTIDDIRKEGITSLSGIAARLNELGEETPRGGPWTATQVQRVLARA